MSLNHVKSNVTWFKTKSKRCLKYPSIFVHNTILKSVDKQKYLGIMFDSKLSWILISSHKHCLSAYLIKLLIESLVFSHLNYCLPMWGPTLTQQLSQRLERMQNRAVRLCKHLSKFDHVSEYYRQLKWLPFKELVQLHSMRLMYCKYHHAKCIPLLPPIEFGPHHSHDTRTAAHVGVKLKTRVTKPSIILPLGNYLAGIHHLKMILQNFSKDQHGMRITGKPVLKLLQQIPDAKGTLQYLNICVLLLTAIWMSQSHHYLIFTKHGMVFSFYDSGNSGYFKIQTSQSKIILYH